MVYHRQSWMGVACNALAEGPKRYAPWALQATHPSNPADDRLSSRVFGKDGALSNLRVGSFPELLFQRRQRSCGFRLLLAGAFA
jgi:hypothetical protein